MSSKTISEPSRDCPLCPRLAGFRQAQRAAFPDWHNAPVPCFGNPRARLMIVGLAPGLRGANRTGRPFTGDYAGDLLFATLKKLKLATGDYEERPDDTLTLTGARICNSVRCVPPENKPLLLEVRQCNSFLKAEIAAMPELRVLLALGRIAHDAALTALGEKPSRFTFGHGARHEVQGFTLFDSYHCSRYNTNTGRLTAEMFETVMADAARLARA